MERKKFHIGNLTARHRKKLHIWLRAGIQLICFLLFSSAFTAAFGGVKYIAVQLGAGEKVEWTGFTAALSGLCGFTIVFGRFFCGFACAFGSLGDFVHGVYCRICRKCRKKPLKLNGKWCAGLSSLKYFVLAVIAVLCFLGVYPKLRGSSPWDVFSMIRGGNFRLAGYLPGLVILLLILAGMCVQERFFCRFLCPMGAVFSMLPVLPVFSLSRNRETCAPRCSACTGRCPSDIQLPADGSYETSGDCFQCQKCVDTCPKQNIHCQGEEGLRGNEAWFTVVRSGIFIAVCIWIGI